MNLFDRSGEWLVILPDHPESTAIAARLGLTSQRVDHPSGRPWLIGEWDPADLRVGTAGPTKVATLGFCSADSARLTDIAAHVRHVAELDRAQDKLAGCFHLLATVRGTTRSQGTLSGLRRLVYTQVGGMTVAATRADALAALAGADVDEQRLLLRLLLSEVALHTVNMPLWHGIHAVEEDHSLILSPQGNARMTLRWTPPADDLSLNEAAGRLREALTDAVQTRVDSGLSLTADLSGGLDSTTLCFLLARAGSPLTTLTTLAADLGDDDPKWADIAAKNLPGVRRLKVPFTDLPTSYGDLLKPGPAGEEPFPGVEDRTIYRAIAKMVGAEGSQAHITGDGGDEALPGGSTGVFDILRTRPLTALSYMRGYRALEHWTWSDIGRMALEQRRSYPAWLADRARRIVASPLDDEDEGASSLLQLPPWATPDAVAAARKLLGEEAGSARQHGRNWTAHHTIWGIRLCASLIRGTASLYAAEGVRLTSPYLDDAVINACMSARAHERRTPWTYKPLLTEAMRGIVPDQSLARTTKAEGSNVEHTGIRTNISKLAGLCEDSRLAALGLIDPAKLRAICTGFQIRLFTPYAMSMTFSCERWLRDLESQSAEPMTLSRTDVEASR
ncbi:asparagine synthase-related protein [Streptomyces sp. SAJ15]|uniref:asparagine synthase-related protein n=1 Tax=Streptomyces sp. SAJ15 TaxID=2011095 RepID=UPI0011868580|nr:asparagine synthase-related protein [Streptomyces sp. SAJ15]TVL87533.1 asparagine synthase [Streptomyces sp. SAJ15]